MEIIPHNGGSAPGRLRAVQSIPAAVALLSAVHPPKVNMRLLKGGMSAPRIEGTLNIGTSVLNNVCTPSCGVSRFQQL
jgi:hypothetical protein